jgi:hypothetical protein
MRRGGGLLALALAAAFLPPPAAVLASSPAVGWTITRTGRGAALLEGDISAAAGSEDATMVLFALKGGAQRAVDYTFVTSVAEWGVDGWAEVYGEGFTQPACPAACADPVGVPGHLYISSNNRAIASVVHVAAWDVVNPKLALTTPGWRVRPWRPSMRLLTAATAEGSGATVAHESVGSYQGGSLDGGRHGSLVFAGIPCDNAGDGAATLTGYGRPWAMRCDGLTSALTAAPGGARWRVAGDVSGWGSYSALLVVVDFPPPP